MAAASKSRLVRHEDDEAVEGIPEIAFIVLASGVVFGRLECGNRKTATMV